MKDANTNFLLPDCPFWMHKLPLSVGLINITIHEGNATWRSWSLAVFQSLGHEISLDRRHRLLWFAMGYYDLQHGFIHNCTHIFLSLYKNCAFIYYISSHKHSMCKWYILMLAACRSIYEHSFVYTECSGQAIVSCDCVYIELSLFTLYPLIMINETITNIILWQ